MRCVYMLLDLDIFEILLLWFDTLVFLFYFITCRCTTYMWVFLYFIFYANENGALLFLLLFRVNSRFNGSINKYRIYAEGFIRLFWLRLCFVVRIISSAPVGRCSKGLVVALSFCDPNYGSFPLFVSLTSAASSKKRLGLQWE